MDPDIPDDHQRVLFTSSRSDHYLAWQLTGEVLAPATEDFPWQPRKGRFPLALVDRRSGRELDRVKFVVRRRVDFCSAGMQKRKTVEANGRKIDPLTELYLVSLSFDVKFSL